MKVLICGGRDFNDQPVVNRVLNHLHGQRPFSAVVSGCARGADRAGETWAESHGVSILRYPADWDTHGKKAGSIRNTQMLQEGQPDLVVSFPGGVGTAHMVRISRSSKVPVVLIQRELDGYRVDHLK